MNSIYEFKKYQTDATRLKKTLEKYGVAIIPSVLSHSETEGMKNGMWDSLEHITQKMETPLSRDDQTTWRSFYELFPLHSMLLQHWQIGHAQFVWELRQNPKIIEIFRKFWGTDDLLVSFDGVSFHLPPEVTKKGWFQTSSKWLHTDQSYTRNGFECMQSWVTAYDVNEGDATLTFLEKSHLYHGEFAETFGITEKSNWYKLEDEEHVSFYKNKGCKQKSIRCPAGSMVFWDSRTIHAGQEAVKGRENQNIRNVVYLCYMPRELASPTDIKKKISYFETQRLTSHWPCKIKVFGKNPRTYGKELPPTVDLPTPILRDVGLSLAGYELDVDDDGYRKMSFC